MCLAAFNGPGITEGVGRLAKAAAVDIGASKLVPGLKRRDYSSKATPTLSTSMATVMGKPVRG